MMDLLFSRLVINLQKYFKIIKNYKITKKCVFDLVRGEVRFCFGGFPAVGCGGLWLCEDVRIQQSNTRNQRILERGRSSCCCCPCQTGPAATAAAATAATAAAADSSHTPKQQRENRRQQREKRDQTGDQRQQQQQHQEEEGRERLRSPHPRDHWRHLQQRRSR